MKKIERILFEQKINIRKAKRRSRFYGFNDLRFKVVAGLLGLIFINAGFGIISQDGLVGFIPLVIGVFLLWVCYYLFKLTKENIWSTISITEDHLILVPAAINPQGKLHIPLSSILFLKLHGADCSIFLENNERANKFWKSYQERTESDFDFEYEKKNIEIYDDYTITMKESIGPVIEKIGEIRAKELPYIT